MFIAKTTKYAFFALGCLFYSFLLLTLSACNATSDPRPVYQATGSWQGTIGTDQVQGVIAPDRTYQLAIIDAGGNPVGAYVGVIGSIDAENLGSMTLIRLHTTENAGAQQQFTFKLSADRLFSFQGIELARTAEANGPAVPSAVAGHWSLASADNFTDVVVNADGTVSGGDGVNCRYSGTLNLIDPAWNIYSLNMTLADIPGGTCNDSDFNGLAMILPPENERRRIWFAANNRIVGGARTLFGEWSETINVAPLARMTILGDRTSTGPESSVLVQEGSAVEFDAQGSSDDNSDLLTYTWSGTAPDGVTPLNIQGTKVATFIPTVIPGLYTINLTVSDGIVGSTLTRQLRVERTLDRFTACGNGTVLDTRTNLLWLQDAGCVALNKSIIWGVSHAEAVARVSTLTSGVCELNDNSAAGDWNLPTLNDFSHIVPQSQWSEGNLFVNVGTNPDPLGLGSNLPLYWTADSDPAIEFNWFFVDINYVAPADWFGSYFENNATAVWPVRALRPEEQCPAVP